MRAKQPIATTSAIPADKGDQADFRRQRHRLTKPL